MGFGLLVLVRVFKLFLGLARFGFGGIRVYLEVILGSYKWGYNTLIRVISLVTLLITPRITTHEPPK